MPRETPAGGRHSRAWGIGWRAAKRAARGEEGRRAHLGWTVGVHEPLLLRLQEAVEDGVCRLRTIQLALVLVALANGAHSGEEVSEEAEEPGRGDLSLRHLEPDLAPRLGQLGVVLGAVLAELVAHLLVVVLRLLPAG